MSHKNGEIADAVQVWSNETKTGFHQRIYTMYLVAETEEEAKSMRSRVRDGDLDTGVYLATSLDRARELGSHLVKALVYPGHAKKIKSYDDPLRKTWNRDYGCAWVPTSDCGDWRLRVCKLDNPTCHSGHGESMKCSDGRRMKKINAFSPLRVFRETVS